MARQVIRGSMRLRSTGTIRGDSTASLKTGGFPGVDLKSENGGQSWLPCRSSARGQLRVHHQRRPGDKNEAHTCVFAFVFATPPNETTSLTLKWPWGALVDQAGATHPATFVDPIG